MAKEVRNPNPEKPPVVRLPVSSFGFGNCGSWRASSHASLQLGQCQPRLGWKAIGLGNRLAAGIRSAMKRIVDQSLPCLGILPNMKFSLRQSKGDAFAALVQHEECHHLLADAVFDLTRDGRLFVAE